MTPLGALVATVPIIVAVISGRIAYLQARKVSEKNAEIAETKARVERDRIAADDRRANQAGYERLTRDLQKEIARLRDDRGEDSERHARAMQALTDDLRTLRDDCQEQAETVQAQGRELVAFEAWAAEVVVALQRPRVAAALVAERVVLPPPPSAAS